MPLHIKICGVTTVEDAVWLADLGADALGVNLIPSSKRHVEAAMARAIRRAVGGRVEVIAVVADLDEAGLQSVRSRTGIDWLQLHGDESAASVATLQPRAYKAVRIGGPADVTVARAMPGDRVLVDAKTPGQLGGTGHAFDWGLVQALAAARPVVLAGGLTPDTVARAIGIVRPWGVDVASGVEVEGDPRRKDRDRVERFLQNARRAAP